MRTVVLTGLNVVSLLEIGKDLFLQCLLYGASGETNFNRASCCDLFDHHYFGLQVACEASYFDMKLHHVSPACHTVDRSIQFPML